MTVITACIKRDDLGRITDVFMASDSLISIGDSVEYGGKINRTSLGLLGHSGSGDVDMILNDNPDCFKHKTLNEASQWLRDQMEKYRFIGSGESPVESNSNFLVANLQGIFIIHSNFHIIKSRKDYAAIGSGSEVALGAMYSCFNSGNESATSVVLSGVTAACSLLKSCGGPVFIRSVEGSD